MRKIAKYRPSNQYSALRQGEILTNVIQYNPVLLNAVDQDTTDIKIKPVTHPYVIVVTQDCDLDWDFKARLEGSSPPSKLLNSIILCEIATAREIRQLSDKSIMNTKVWQQVKTHKHERFYFFEHIPVECDLEQTGVPELTADFKKVFGVDADTLYQQLKRGSAKRRTTLASPYLEHFSKRYFTFHGRIALPSQYESFSDP